MGGINLNFNKNMRMIQLFFFVALLCPAGNMHQLLAEEAADYKNDIRQLRWVLIEVENLNPKLESPARLVAQIRSDTAKRFALYNLHPRITTKVDTVKSSRYLRIHIHKIRLERTVYLSTLEWVDTRRAVFRQDSGAMASPPKYTKVSNQIKTVRRKVRYMLNELIRDYIR